MITLPPNTRPGHFYRRPVEFIPAALVCGVQIPERMMEQRIIDALRPYEDYPAVKEHIGQLILQRRQRG